jgi:Raf kinase inhibitor-like YbhB/YbcL family protein
LVLTAALLSAGCGSGAGSAADNTVATPVPSVPTPSVAPSSLIRVSVDAFADGATIPQDYTCRGAGKRPVVSWTGVPSGGTSTALAVTDPDAPSGEYIHWLVVDLPPDSTGRLGAGPVTSPAKEAANSSGTPGWKAPCPPKGTGTHHYHVTVFAVAGTITAGDSTAELAAIRKQATAQGEVVGLVAAQS